MGIKVVNAVIAIIGGIGGAIIIFWILNKLAESLKGRWEDRVKPWMFAGPAILAIAVYLIYPAVVTIQYSFANEDSTAYVGLSNYKDLLTDNSFLQVLFNNVLWIIIVPAMTVVLGLGVAVLADRLRPRGEKSAKTFIFLPMAISMVGAATVWRFLYAYRPPGQEQIGLQNALVVLLGGKPVPWLQQDQFHLNSLLLMVMLLWAQIGFAMVLLSAAIKGVPVDTLEAARIDGAGERQIFFRVVVPQIKGTIITVFVTTLITVMKIFDIVYVMTNGNFNTNILGVEFYNQLFTNFNNGAAAAIVVILMVAMAPIMIFQVRNFKAEEAA
jgi:alpha-glucoside transport system permease protein